MKDASRADIDYDLLFKDSFLNLLAVVGIIYSPIPGNH